MTRPISTRCWHDRLGRAVRGRPLWVNLDGTLLLGRSDGGISHFDPSSKALRRVTGSPYGLSLRTLSNSLLATRLLRLAPRAFVQLQSGTLLWVAGKHIWKCNPNDSRPISVFRFEVGSGPLFIAVEPDGSVVFGDYVADRQRRPSAIRRSVDGGDSWHVLHEFSAERIRHVHGVFWDPYSSCIWLTSGDADQESGLWVLEGDEPKLVAGGRSIYRVVQPVFTTDAIFFGTDTPGESCGIYRLTRSDSRVDFLQPARGPVFFGTSVASRIAFSTAVEPGHSESSAALYLSDAQDGFQEVLALSKDRFDMRLFQYGQIYLPANYSAGRRLWFSPCATEYDHYLFSIDVNEMEGT